MYVVMGHELGGHGMAPRSVAGQHGIADHAYRRPVTSTYLQIQQEEAKDDDILRLTSLAILNHGCVLIGKRERERERERESMRVCV